MKMEENKNKFLSRVLLKPIKLYFLNHNSIVQNINWNLEIVCQNMILIIIH